jgi:histidine triad (HIT) family protein
MEPAVPYDPENVFAKILRGEIPSERVFEDPEFVAFRDIAPQAPVHVILIPRGEPPASATELRETDADWLGRMVLRAAQIAGQQGLAGQGYRLIVNCGEHGGQTVAHFHMHILGGRQLGALG